MIRELAGASFAELLQMTLERTARSYLPDRFPYQIIQISPAITADQRYARNAVMAAAFELVAEFPHDTASVYRTSVAQAQFISDLTNYLSNREVVVEFR